MDKGVGGRYNRLDRRIFQKLKQNDESITGLRVAFVNDDDGECFFNSVNWKEDGDYIAKNTQLKRLILERLELEEVGHNECTRQQLQDFFSCIQRNSSISSIFFKRVVINDSVGGGLIEGLCGHPSLSGLAFIRSCRTRTIPHLEDLDRPHKLGSIGCTAIGKVLKYPNCKLKDLRLSKCQLDDETLGIVCDALLGNSSIKTLHLNDNKDITSSGWRIVSYVLQHPNCKLIDLNLSHNNISRSCKGWQTLLNQLSQTSIECLNISHNGINDSDLAILANVGTLVSMSLRDSSCTPAGWRSFFNLLQTRGTQLVELDISQNTIGDIGVTALGKLLRNMATMEALIMHAMKQISSQGWQAFFTILQDSNMSLVQLSFHNNIIDDEGMQLLVRLVSRMSFFRFLDLSKIRLVSPVGWQVLSDYIQSPNFALTKLHLYGNNINDDTVVAFANALTHNNTLERLHICGCADEEGIVSITDRGWNAVSNLICNKTSITDTYYSNHSLWCLLDLYDNHVYGRDDAGRVLALASYLKLNENDDKVEVARQKILQTHFSSEDDTTSSIQELLSVELKVMPTAIAWVGRPSHDYWRGMTVSGLSLMYHLMRKLPDLVDSSAQKKHASKKRKRTEVQFCCVS